jgi:hypothetical protein
VAAELDPPFRGRQWQNIPYRVLCRTHHQIRIILPGSPTIPDQIISNRQAYFAALDSADAAWRDEQVNVSAMESLLAGMLARQLAGFYESAGGKLPPGVDLNSA